MIRKIVLILVLLSFGSLYAESPYDKFSGKGRPKIGVVLSGGGAKGFAHIAILEKLEKLNIPIDYIAGTSMGSTVAALYSMGYSIEDLKKIARDTDWFSYFSNAINRNQRNFIRKSMLDRYPLSLDISEDGIEFPRGLVNGQHIALFLSRLTWGAHNIKDFKNLPIPFICIGTDMETGKEKIFRGGNLPESLRASMAIPSIFNPVEIDGKIYQDGGIVNNFPVKELRKMGADIIIGVDVSSPLYNKSELNSIPRILEQTTSFLSSWKTEEQRKLCDILILPDISRFSPTSFESVDKIIYEGERAVSYKLEELRELSIFMKKYKLPVRKSIVIQSKDKYLRVDKINFYGIRKSTYKILRKTFPIKEGTLTDVEKIESAVNYTYGSGFFERISYNIEKQGNRNILNLHFSQQPETKLNFGFMFDSDSNSSILLNLFINDFGLQNSLTSIDARIGELNKIEGHFVLYTPFDPGVGIGLTGKAYDLDIYLYENGVKTTSYNMTHYSGALYLGTIISNWLMLFIGVEKEFYYYDSEVSSLTNNNTYRFDALNFYAYTRIDSMDDHYYPTSGLFLEGRVEYIRSDVTAHESDDDYDNFNRYVLYSKLAVPLPGSLSLIGGLGGSMCDTENVPPPYYFAMGGYQRYEDWIFPFYGYEFTEVYSQNGYIYFLNLQWEFFNNFFLTAKWNHGRTAWDFKDLFTRNEEKYTGYGLSLGYKSLFGPVEFSIFKKHNEDDYTFHFNLGLEY